MAYAVVQRGASKGVWNINSCEGSSFSISAQVAVSMGFFEDQEIDYDQYTVLKRASELQSVRTKALDLLAIRDHSRYGLSTKLLQRGFSKDIVDEVLASLTEKGLLSDRRFAESFVRMRQNRNPEGPSVLESRLMQNGVDRQIATEVLSEWFSDEDNVEKALSKAARKIIRSTDDKQKIIMKLRRKGFSKTQISEILNQTEA